MPVTLDRCPHKQLNAKNGFTLLEVILVLVLVSIFTVLAITQYSASDASLTAQAQVLASHLRYAQLRSMNTDSRWGILYSSAGPDSGFYQLFHDSTAQIAQLPGEDRDRVNLGAMGITISSAAALNTPIPQNFEIRFDSWGIPTSDVAGAATLTLRLTKPGHTAQALSVTRNTGFIP
jgi:prepilin-type N-terminal cleavage/methylation domain-containing protein